YYCARAGSSGWNTDYGLDSWGQGAV
nr:anti-SIV gp148 Ig heavy chain {CDR3 heavy chain region} [Macaca fascicularis=cynomolgus monkey, Peptide Partial, 25 aa] [Macaca fascicularis]